MILTGAHLTKDAATRTTTKNGQKTEFASFTVAHNEQVGDQRITTYYEVTAAKSGNFPYLKKGQAVNIVGTFRQSTTKAQDGREFNHNNISAYKVEVQFSKTSDAQAESPQPGEW